MNVMHFEMVAVVLWCFGALIQGCLSAVVLWFSGTVICCCGALVLW
jgi:hypothetical protein